MKSVWFPFCLAIVLYSASAQSTVLLEMSVDELAAGADLVVIADVLEQHVEWDEAASRVRTLTRIRIESVISPTGAPESAGTELIIEQEGGVLEDWGVRVAGNAPLAVGERALLFLLRGDRYVVFGMEQGKYAIVADEGTPRVFRALTVPVATRATADAPLTLMEPAAPWNGRTLDELVQHLQAGVAP